MPMVRYESIFIDLDDTIWDFRTNSKVALHKVYDIHNLSQFYNTFEEYYSVYSEKNTELWNMYHHGLSFYSIDTKKCRPGNLGVT